MTNNSRVQQGNIEPSSIEALNRLSQDDINDRSLKLADKWSVRKRMCQQLAEKHGLPLLDGNIHYEQQSGGFLDDRPVMLGILQRIESGITKHLIVPFYDRVLRGDKYDEGRMERIFIKAGLILYTSDKGVIDFGDENYDPTTVEIESFVARHERRKGIQKRRTADNARIEDNKRSQGAPPWCYFKVDRHNYGVWEDRFAAADEIFIRAWSEPLRTICRDFNQRRIPSPYSYRWDKRTMLKLASATKDKLHSVVEQLNSANILSGNWSAERLLTIVNADDPFDQLEFNRACNAAGIITPYPMKWKAQTLREILRNPFFAGRISRRKKWRKGREKVKLNWSDYEIAPKDGQWRKCISYDRWCELMVKMGDVHRTGVRARTGLLTGICFCWRGRAMCLDGAPTYTCPCQYEYDGSPCGEAGRDKFDNFAKTVVFDVLSKLPDSALHWCDAASDRILDRGAVQKDLARESAHLAELKDNAAKLQLRRDENILLFGEEQYFDAAKRVKKDIEHSKSEVERLQRQLAQPNWDKSGPLLQAVRSVGTDALWESADFEMRRALVETVILRIDVPKRPEGQKRFKEVHVTFQEWVTEIIPNHMAPPIQNRRGTPKRP